MTTNDTCCTIVPYFKVNDGKLDQFKEICERFIEKSRGESKCLYYGFSFNGNDAHCREGYDGAEGVLTHLDNVGDLIAEALLISDLERLEIHGVESELALLREPLAELSPKFFVLEGGFRH